MVVAYQIGLEDCLGAGRDVLGASPPSKGLKRERKTVWQTGCLNWRDDRRPSERAAGYNRRKDIVPYILVYSSDGIPNLQRSEVQSRQLGIRPMILPYGLSNRVNRSDLPRSNPPTKVWPRFFAQFGPQALPTLDCWCMKLMWPIGLPYACKLSSKRQGSWALSGLHAVAETWVVL